MEGDSGSLTRVALWPPLPAPHIRPCHVWARCRVLPPPFPPTQSHAIASAAHALSCMPQLRLRRAAMGSARVRALSASTAGGLREGSSEAKAKSEVRWLRYF